MKKATFRGVFFLLIFISIKLSIFCQINTVSKITSCNVQAKISPGNDSIIVNNSSLVTFTSESINATSFKFIVDNTEYPINASLTYSFVVGVTEIKLVALNGSCTDTAKCFYFNYGNYPNDTNNIFLSYGIRGNSTVEAVDFITSKDSGLIIASDRDQTSYANYLPPAGIVLKTTPRNCIQWSKIYEPIANNQNNIVCIDESNEKDIYVALSQYSNSSILIKNDNFGNEVWTRKFINIGNNDSIKISKIKILQNGNILVLGKNLFTNEYLRILLLDKNGNLLWQKKLNKTISLFQNLINTIEKGNYIYVCSNGIYRENNIDYNYGIITKINSQSGITVWSKNYKINNAGKFFMYKVSLVDDFIAISTSTPTQNSTNYNLCSIIFIDEEGAVKKSKELLFERQINTTDVDIFQIKDKKYFIFIKGLEVIPNISIWSHSTVALLDSNFNTISVRNIGGERVLKFFKAIKYNENSIALITSGLGYGITGLSSFSKRIIINKIDTSNYFLTPLCPSLQINTPVQQINVNTENFNWDIDNNNIDIESKDATSSKFYTVSNANVQFRYECPSYIDSCSFLKISGPSTVCDVSSNYTYKIHRNKTCNQIINWNLPANITIIQQTDSTVTIKYNNPGAYKIAVSIPFGCNPLYESITTQVKLYNEVLNLGDDKTICKGDEIKLHAGNRFVTYKWQNGSIDSTLRVNTEGLYWIEVMDSCYNILRDSINVKFFPNEFLSIGLDRVKCNLDTIHLSATPGFKSYTWSPLYQISNITNRTVIVNPLVDTLYILMAESNNNCIYADTIKIKVNKTKIINLGVDTALCLNKELTLKISNADFENYLWSNGSVEFFIKIKDSGLYWVIGRDKNNCASTDSIIVSFKDCKFGFYIPNIFTPNNDNKNDIFKPIIFGQLTMFKFSVYNRYGQLVYNNEDYSKGWDGTSNQLKQNEGTYVWMCSYQLKNKQLVNEKGTFILLR